MADQTRHSALDTGVIAWISIGSNLQQPVTQVRRALTALTTLPETTLLWQSQLYATDPVGSVEQPAFINAVARLSTHLSAFELLHQLQELETIAGRRRAAEIYWGPRVLDLDMLSYGDYQSSDPQLRLPHPRLHERAFVLVPLAEFDAQLTLSGCGCIAEHLLRVSDQGVRRLVESADHSSVITAKTAQA